MGQKATALNEFLGAEYCRGDFCGRPIRINRRPSPLTPVGARAVGSGRRAFMVARVLFIWLPSWGTRPHPTLFPTHVERGRLQESPPTSTPPLPLQRRSLRRRFTRSHCKGGSGADVGWGP